MDLIMFNVQIGVEVDGFTCNTVDFCDDRNHARKVVVSGQSPKYIPLGPCNQNQNGCARGKHTDYKGSLPLRIALGSVVKAVEGSFQVQAPTKTGDAPTIIYANNGWFDKAATGDRAGKLLVPGRACEWSVPSPRDLRVFRWRVDNDGGRSLVIDLNSITDGRKYALLTRCLLSELGFSRVESQKIFEAGGPGAVRQAIDWFRAGCEQVEDLPHRLADQESRDLVLEGISHAIETYRCPVRSRIAQREMENWFYEQPVGTLFGWPPRDVWLTGSQFPKVLKTLRELVRYGGPNLNYYV